MSTYSNTFFSAFAFWLTAAGIMAGILMGFWPFFTLAAVAALVILGLIFFFPRTTTLVLAFLLPWQIALGGGTGFDIVLIRAAIPILFISWLIEKLRSGNLVIPVTPVALSLYAFLAWAAFSISYAAVPEFTLRKILLFASIFPLFLIVHDYARSKKFKQKLLLTLFITASLSAIVGITQFLLQYQVGLETIGKIWATYVAPLFLGGPTAALVVSNPSWFVNIAGVTLMRAIATFPDPHIFSFFLGMSLPLGLVMLNRPALRTLVILGAGLIVIALLLTFSRGGYWGLANSILVVGIVWLLRSVSIKKLIASTAVLFLVVLAFLNIPFIKDRVTETFSGSEGSALGRVAIWQDAWQVFLENPILGVGLGNYPVTVDPLIEFRNSITAHSAYLDILAELGLVGYAFGFLAFSFAFARIGKGILNKKLRPEHWLMRLALLGSLVYFAAHATFETPIFSPRILPLLLILLAVISVQSKTRNEKSIQKLWISRLHFLSNYR